MADLTCVDGSTLSVLPEAVLDRDDVAYEMTLRLVRDSEPFGVVGERCGFFLATLAGRLAGAIAGGGPLADGGTGTAVNAPEDRFPPSSMEAGVRAWAHDEGRPADAAWATFTRYLPRERSLFSFRRRDPDDPARSAELRCSLRTSKSWVATDERGLGRWVLRERAVLDAWGDGGQGVRAMLTAPELLEFLQVLLAQADAIGIAYPDTGPIELQRPVG
ncbi:MAG: hypothetical protein KDC23_13325 [Actinobacteria bacterium]|nr:hypothetical protein [Actinomycetota bacterium]